MSELPDPIETEPSKAPVRILIEHSNIHFQSLVAALSQCESVMLDSSLPCGYSIQAGDLPLILYFPTPSPPAFHLQKSSSVANRSDYANHWSTAP